MVTSGSEKADRQRYSVVIADVALRESKIDLELFNKSFPNSTVASLNDAQAFANADVAILPYKVQDKHSYQWLWSLNEYTQIIILDRNLSVPKTTQAMQNGVVDVLFKPISTERLLLAVERAIFLGRNPGLSTHRYLWNIFKAMERMNQTHDEGRLVHLFCNTMMKETHARAAIVFREVAGDWLPVRSFFPQHPLTPVSRVECLRLARSLKEKWKPQDEESLPEPSYVTLPEGFRLLDVGLVGDVLVIPIRCSPSPLICCFLDPPSVLKKRVNLEILASFAQHTSGALDAAQNYRRMSELVYIDEVTGLFNARYLPLVLEARHKVYEKESAPFVVLFIDLDQFKKVNDTFGHLVGSDVLVKAGHVIRRSVRYDDAVFRYGGDEFVVILANSDLTGGVGAAERIRRNLESHMFDSHGVRVAVTATIGVACFPQHVSDINSIVDSADRAMYEGKRTSRNVVLVYDQGLQQTGS